MKKLLLGILLAACGSANAANVSVNWEASNPAPDGTPLASYGVYCENTPNLADRVTPNKVKSTSASNLSTTITLADNLDWFCAIDVKDMAGNVSALSVEISFNTNVADAPVENKPSPPGNPTFTVLP